MSERQWTKGPWMISLESPTIIKKDYRRIGSDGGELIASACGYTGSGFFPSDDEAKHNAHLIAAAPEMYEALEAIIQKAPPSGPLWHGSEEIENACAALKKARGKQ